MKKRIVLELDTEKLGQHIDRIGGGEDIFHIYGLFMENEFDQPHSLVTQQWDWRQDKTMFNMGITVSSVEEIT